MSRARLFAASVAAHALLVGLVVFHGGLDAHHGPVRLDMSPDQVVAAYGLGDAGSLMRAAIALTEKGRVPPGEWFVLDLWPPGMVWVDALAVKFSPLPVAVTVSLGLALVWGVALALVSWPLVRARRWLPGLLVVELLLLSTWPFESWILDEGLLYADGFAAGFLLIGLALVVHRAMNGGPRRLWFRDGMLAGVAVAASVYFRASNNLVPVALAGLTGLLCAAVLVQRLRRRRPDRSLVTNAVLTGTAAATTILLMLPYGALVFHREQRLQFVNTQDLLYSVSWQYANEDPLPQWLLDSGDPLGCDLDPEQCAEFIAQEPGPSTEELRDALIRAIVENPGAWASQRTETLVRQWFTYDADPAEGYGYLALVLAVLGVTVLLARRGRWALLMVPLTFLALVGPFAFVHVEERYLIPIKLLGLFAPALLLAWATERRGRRPGRPAGARRAAQA